MALCYHMCPQFAAETNCYKHIAMWKYHDRKNKTVTASINLDSFMGLVVRARMPIAQSTEKRDIHLMRSAKAQASLDIVLPYVGVLAYRRPLPSGSFKLRQWEQNPRHMHMWAIHNTLVCSSRTLGTNGIYRESND